MNTNRIYTAEEIHFLKHCTLCPRNCAADRFSSRLGYCKSDASFSVSSVCIHKGEEPAISGNKGICNIFFPHCNLQCIYCQNHDISSNNLSVGSTSFEMLIQNIGHILDETENMVGFVSPSHYIPQMLAIIRGIKESGRDPVFVYNTNGYDKVETLQMLEGIIDVYLPDFKYADSQLSKLYSEAADYPDVAKAAIKEMFRQKGSRLFLNENGTAESGIIIRHLVIPGATENSKEVLGYIAGELSPNIHMSIMSQYFPTSNVRKHEVLGRNIYKVEYQAVTDAFYQLGFHKGWIQDLSSEASYRPNFSNDKPFEE